MPTGSTFTDKIAERLPEWLAWPMSALSTLSGFIGAALVLLAASTGSVGAAVWAAISFVLAAVAWHLSEFAGDAS